MHPRGNARTEWGGPAAPSPDSIVQVRLCPAGALKAPDPSSKDSLFAEVLGAVITGLLLIGIAGLLIDLARRALGTL